MLLQNIQEASLIRANYLLSLEKTEDSLQSAKSELNSLSNLLGIEFDKGIYILLLDQIDFKDSKIFTNSKSIKYQYFIDIIQRNITNEKFINFFSEVLSQTKNNNSVKEILDTLNQLMDLTEENQLKILLSFVLSKNQKYYNDAINLLYNKIKKLEKEKKLSLINSNLSQDILLILSQKKNKIIPSNDSSTGIKNDINLYSFNTLSKTKEQNKEKISENLKLLSLLEDKDSDEELIPLEKLYSDMGPMIFNTYTQSPKSPLLDNNLDAKKIAELITTIVRKSPFDVDKEIRIMNEAFLKSLDLEYNFNNEDKSSDKISMEWNVQNFYKEYKNEIDAINPKDIFKYLDNPNFLIKDKKKFEVFMNILKSFEIIKNNNYELLFDFLFTKWNNEENQIQLLHYLISNPQSDSFNFKHYKGKRTKQHTELNFSISKSTNSYLIEPWTCIALIEVLLELSHGNNYIKVKELFNYPIQYIPEIIALGLIQITKKPNDFLYDELIQEVLTLFLGNHMNSFSVIEEVWNSNKELVISAIANMYNSSPDLMNLSRILDITQKLKESLLLLVNCSDYKFAVNLAILAVKRDFLHIDSWLKERIKTVGDDFMLALIDYIKENLINHCKGNNKNKESVLEKAQLSLESLGVIMENLSLAKHSTNPKVSKSTEELVQEIQSNIYKTFKEFSMEQVNGKEVEDRANRIFQNMFKGETEVHETIEQLKLLKNSQSQTDRETYACMIHCLLDEYRFYHQYPEKQLNIISTLFGQIINNKLIDGVIEAIALKYILEGIKKGTGHLFIFGTKALEQFKDKLHEYPAYIKSLIETKQLKNDPLLYEAVLEKYNSINNLIAAPNPESNLINMQNQNIIPLSLLQGINSANNFQNVPQIKNKMYPGGEEINCAPGAMFDKDIGNNSSLNIKNNNRTINNNNDNNYNQMMYKNNNNEQFYGLNNMNPDLQINPQILQSGIGQNIPELINNQIPNINILPNGTMDSSQIYLGNNINQLHNSSNNLTSIPSQSGKINQNIISNNNISINDQMSNLEEQNKRQKARREQNLPKNESNILSSANDAYFGEFNNININPIKNNNQNNSLGEIFNNEMDHKIQSNNIILFDKIQFILNQLGKNNIKEKANEIKQICNTENLLKSFSDFLIVNRIITEKNNHELYFELINLIDQKNIINYQISDTIKYIHKLLNSKSLEEMNERNALKNLGSYLGKLTLYRNKPILAKDIDFRDLLLNAFESGKLFIIVPFVSKILENSIHSRVFNLRNPWMKAILSILNSIFNMTNISKNISFEIQELFEKLQIKDLTEFTNNFLDGKIPNKNSQDFNNNQIIYNNNTQMSSSLSPSNFINNGQYDMNSNSSNKLTQIPKHITLNMLQDEQQNMIKKELYNQIIQGNYLKEINQIFEMRKIYEQNLVEKNQIGPLIYKILNESINNIINPVIERAVTISLITTKELVIKDFQFEPDEKKFIMAATNFIKSLAGALASVTCKEPLRMSFSKRIKDIFTEKKIDNETFEEVAKMKYTGDLLNIGCNYIFNYVQKQAEENVLKDETIQKEIQRRKNIDPNGTKLFSYDNNSSLMNIVNKLPTLLKPNKKGLTKEQLNIYSNYPTSIGASRNDSYKNNLAVNEILRVLKEVLECNSIRNYDIFLQNVRTIITNNCQNSHDLEEGSEALKMFEKAFSENKLKEAGLSEEEEAKTIIQYANLTLKYTYKAFEAQNKKLLNVFISFLKGWIKSTNYNVCRELTSKLMSSSFHPWCFNIQFHIILFNLNMIDIREYQNYILSHLEIPSSRKLSFNLITNLKKYKIYTPSLFPKLLEFYFDEDKCNKYFSLFGKYCKLPSDLNIITEYVINYKICNIKDQKTYNIFIKMCTYAFNRIVSNRFPLVKMDIENLSSTLDHFIRSPFISNEEQLNVFTMIITEICTKRIPNGNESENYPDNQARCIYTLLMALPKDSNRLRMFGNILNGIFKTFHQDYVITTFKFNQRPYFKLFYTFISLFNDLPNNAKVFNSENTKIQFMLILAEFLKNPAPNNYPGFTLAWLELISSHSFISCFLDDNTSFNKERNDAYSSLVTNLFVFLKSCCLKQVNKICIEYIYKYVFLLCNTYPDFISEYYYLLLIALPLENYYMQLKNLILSATPRKLEQYKNINFEDKDLEKEIKENTFGDYKVKTSLDIIGILKNFKVFNYIEDYIKNPNIEIIKIIYETLNKNNNRTFNFYVIYSLVVYYSMKVLTKAENLSKAYNFFFDMIKFMETDNLINIINSLLNELRFPSKQTLYFILIINYILVNIKNVETEEVIISLLLERLLIKPIPWGIELLFKKLLKGDKYDLLNAPYIKNLNGGQWFLHRLKEFLDDKIYVKYATFQNNKIEILLSKDNKRREIKEPEPNSQNSDK